MAGCDAVTYAIQRPNGETLREWKFAREGWLFVAGILRKPKDRPWVEALGLKSLATWQWIAGTESTRVPQRAPTAVTEVTEISEAITTTAAVETVWALIRNVENNRLLHDNFVDAYKVPGTPDGVGEEQSLVLQYPGHRRTVTSILLEEEPPARIVTRTRTADEHDQQVYRLERVGDGTRLSITMRYSVRDAEMRSAQADAAREGIHRYLTRVAEVLEGGWPGRS
jgi:hypothetical protein